MQLWNIFNLKNIVFYKIRHISPVNFLCIGKTSMCFSFVMNINLNIHNGKDKNIVSFTYKNFQLDLERFYRVFF